LVFLSVIFRLCALPILPFDYRAVALEYAQTLVELDDVSDGKFPLREAVRRARDLEGRLETLSQIIAPIADAAEGSLGKSFEQAVARVNRCLIRLGRTLIPTGYTRAGQFEPDPALPSRPLPVLQGVSAMRDMDVASDEFRFASVGARRGLSQVMHALSLAMNEVESALADLERTLGN
jgi:hypothetical protein